MKKTLVFLISTFLVIGVMGFAFALSTTTSLSNTGSSSATETSLEYNSYPNSAHLQADFNDASSTEGRVRIDINDPLTLNELDTVSWSQMLSGGYISHVDIFLESGAVLTAEGAHQNNNLLTGWNEDVWFQTFDGGIACDLSGHWANWLTCPSDLSTVNNKTNVWRSGIGGTAGTGSGGTGCPDMNNLQPLSAYKEGCNDLSGDDFVVAIEIEVDGWVLASEAYIDNVMINGELVEDFDPSNQQDVSGNVGDFISFEVTPSLLQFGNIPYGMGILQDGPLVTINTEASDVASPVGLEFNIEVTTDTGTFYEDLLEFNDGSDWYDVELVTLIVQTDSEDSFMTRLNGDTATYGAGAKTATLTYTVTAPAP